ncbi:hypothetical protein [Rhodopirellula europaea]|uniref:hypothetical protein n=1 Tax=Rhodopirellula europaea TaxID=1263866 RepID=UPI003C6E292A
MIYPQRFIEATKPPASRHRQVQPGLRRVAQPNPTRDHPPVGHVSHGVPTDALEQSEA